MLILTSFQPTDTYSSAILDPITGYFHFKRVIMGRLKFHLYILQAGTNRAVHYICSPWPQKQIKSI